MRPAPLRNILLALSLERTDSDGTVLPLESREQATRDSARLLSSDASKPDLERFFADRARTLIDQAASRFPAIPSAAEPSHRGRFVAPILLLGALALGWTSQALGAEKHVNILSLPLIGILLWNLAVYALEAVSGLTGLRRRSDPVESDSSPASPTAWPERLAEWADQRAIGSEENGFSPPLRQGLTDFRRRWRQLHGPCSHARIRALLHLAAALLAIAALAGMYAKGIANEYRAYWESTFFTPESLHAALGVILGPASALSGISIPDVETLAALRQTSGENAARWIHLYALTIGLFVIVPRLALAGWKAISARRLEHGIDPRKLPHVGLYFDRILADALGTALPVRATAYCHQPTATGEASLRLGLEHRLGVPITLEWSAPIALGEESAFAGSLETSPSLLPAHFVLVANLATTPEQESCGELIRQTRDALARVSPETQLHLCLDAQSYDESRRHLPDFRDRRSDRLAAWRAIAGPLRHQVCTFPDLEGVS